MQQKFKAHQFIIHGDRGFQTNWEGKAKLLEIAVIGIRLITSAENQSQSREWGLPLLLVKSPDHVQIGWGARI